MLLPSCRPSGTRCDFGWLIMEEDTAGLARCLDTISTVDDLTASGMPLGHFAVSQGKHQALSSLLKGGLSPNNRDEYGATVLHIAVREGDGKATSILLSGGADVCARDSSGISPFELSLEYAEPSILELLLDHVDPARIEYDTYVAASRADDASSLAVLLQISVPEQSELMELVELCIEFGNIEGALLLLAEMKDVEATDSLGATPLHKAAAYGELELVIELIGMGADPLARDARGRIPYEYTYAVSVAGQWTDSTLSQRRRDVKLYLEDEGYGLRW